MSDRISLEEWLHRVQEGNAYEAKVRAEWIRFAQGGKKTQRQLKLGGGFGRIDLFIDASNGDKLKNVDLAGGDAQAEEPVLMAVIEFKESDWKSMTEPNPRRNVRRHARQVRGCIDALAEELPKEGFEDEAQGGLCPGIEYPRCPADHACLALIEALLAEEAIAVAWDDGTLGETRARLAGVA